MPYFAYVLQNPAGKFYIGYTENLARRVREHNDPQPGLGKYTHKNGPWQLVWSESHPTRAAAMRREKEIKSWKSSVRIKINLLGSR